MIACIHTHIYGGPKYSVSLFEKKNKIIICTYHTVKSDDKALREESLTKTNQKQQILKLKIE